jgi:hypothetical protein
MTSTILFPIQLFTHYFSQTLTTLDLTSNQIGDQGAQHLANALQQNKVTRFSSLFFPFNYSLSIFHRNSPHLTSIIGQIDDDVKRRIYEILKINTQLSEPRRGGKMKVYIKMFSY